MESKTLTTLDNTERIMSVVSGATLIYNELKKEHSSKLKIALGAYLIQRGVSGKCVLSSLIGSGASSLISKVGRVIG